MTIPLIILAVLTTIFGFIYHPAGDEGIELAVLIPSLGMALLGITTAWILYGLKLFDLSKIAGVRELSIYTDDPSLVEQINGRIFNHTK